MRDRATVIVCVIMGVLLAAGLAWSLERQVLESRLAPRSRTMTEPIADDPVVRSFSPASAELRSADRRPSPGAGELVVLSRSLRGGVHGLVASVVSHGSWANTFPEPRDGREVTETVATPAVAALHSFWITENGRRIEAELRTKTQARAAYEAIVRRRRDPGLLEWVAEGTVSFSLYPVLSDGTPKEASWSMDAVVDVDDEGWRRLPLPVGSLVTRELTLDLVVDEPGGVAEWSLPEGASVRPEDGGAFRITGRWRDVTGSTSTLVVAWRGSRPERIAPAGSSPTTFGVRRLGEGWSGTVAVAVGDSWLPLTILGEGAVEGVVGRVGTVDLSPRLADGPPLAVPPAVWARVLSAARVAERWFGEGDGEGVALLASRERLVSPVSSLFARPEGGGDATVEELAAETVSQRGGGAAPSAAAPSVGRSIFGDGELSFGNFRRSRERAYGRACMANLRTIAGALEMYLLDENMRIDEFVARYSARVGAGALRIFSAASTAVVPAYRRSSLGTGSGAWTDLSRVGPLLVAGGYLQANPEDPGLGRGSQGHYVVTARDLAFCTFHGVHSRTESQPRSARQVLQDLGETDPELLALASDVQSLSATRGREPLFPFVAEPILIVVVAVFMARVGRWYPGPWPLTLVFMGFFFASVLACCLWGPLLSFERTFASIRLVWLVGGGLLASVLALFLPWRVGDALCSKEAVAGMVAEEEKLTKDLAVSVKVGGPILLLLLVVGLVTLRDPGELLMLGAMATVAAAAIGAVAGLGSFAGLMGRLADGREQGLEWLAEHLVLGVLMVLVVAAVLPLAAVLLVYAAVGEATARAMTASVRRSCGG